MTKLTIYLTQSIEQNAGIYFDKAKKIKRKIGGAKDALEKSKNQMNKLLKQRDKEILIEQKETKTSTKKEWYEKFRWFISSEGFLVIGGRDATTNEIIVKKHAEKGDIVFHTDMAGSPFFVIKSQLILTSSKITETPELKFRNDKGLSKTTKRPTEKTLREAADATVSFSRAWKLNVQNTSVFYCSPEQLTKEAPSGEYVPRGGFITKGKLNYIDNKVNLAIGTINDKIIAGPVEAIKVHSEKYIEIEQGREKASAIAKMIKKKLNYNDLDDIIRALPSGGYNIK